jgi:hypothetical protein
VHYQKVLKSSAGVYLDPLG